MSQPPPERPPSPLSRFFRGLGNIVEFMRESVVALLEVAVGKWPQPFGSRRRDPKAPDQGLKPLEKIAPFPIDD